MRVEHAEHGLCPSCGAPVAEYRYVLEGPDSGVVTVHARIKCPVCGYTEAKKIIFPLKGLYAIRYLLAPQVRVDVEKMYLAAGLEGGGLG